MVCLTSDPSRVGSWQEITNHCIFVLMTMPVHEAQALKNISDFARKVAAKTNFNHFVFFYKP